jgi:hypothetical protein
MGKKKRDPSARAQKNTVKLSFLVIIALSGIGTWRDFDLLYLCLVLNALALVLNVLAENLDALKCWWLGVFIAPTTKMVVGEGCCRRAHRQSGAPATSPNRWNSTVGTLTSGATGQSGGALDRSCSLSGAPSGACADSARAVAHCSLLLLQTTVDAVSRCSAGTPDSLGLLEFLKLSSSE